MQYIHQKLRYDRQNPNYSPSRFPPKFSMKKYLLIILIFTYQLASATVFYISPSGNDNTGDGSINSPWRTLRKATTTVTTTGDIIHVNAGVYLETVQSNLAVGVSLEGDGNSSVIQWTGTAQFEPIIYAASSEGTMGNQHISNLMFDGRNLATSWAINIRGRSNFSIYNCTVKDFQDRGIIWGGRDDNSDAPPTIYATGNSFHDNIVTNSSRCNGVYGTGCLGIGGQEGMLVYNNTITSNSRPANTNGWPIKYWNQGHLRGVKIYNNILTAQAIPAGKENGENGFWDFAIEFFYEQGLEIYGNTISGSVDINFNSKGTYPYTAYIHDNVIGFPTFQAGKQAGIIIEFDCETAIIENNIIRNCADAVVFSVRNNTQITNVDIRNNLMYNIGSPGGAYGRGIGNFTDGSTNWNIANMNIYNNTILANTNTALAPFDGISFYDADGVSNLKVKNNIVRGFIGACVNVFPANIVSNSQFQYNNFWNNGYNTPFTNWQGTPVLPAGNIISNSLNINPAFINGNAFDLPPGSPLIDAGVNVNLPYSGSAPDMGYKEFNAGVANVAPTANAGADQNVTLPINTTSLTGTGVDTDGTIVSYQWVKIAGPTGGAITSNNSANTNITGLIQGVYQYQLTVTDNGGANGKDTVIITVIPDPNIAPTANAGPDETITRPASSVTLTGSGADADGTVTAFLWRKISGPTPGVITTAANAITTVTALVAGVYNFELRVTDNNGAFGRDTVQITVNTNPANIAPTANAGVNQTITLPTNNILLNGTGTDVDGTVISYLWSKLTGPAAIIANNTAAATAVNSLVQGIYTFELQVTDDDGAVGRDTIEITVNPDPNIAPTANAGADQTITLPTNTVTLSGTGNDPDGNITAHLWTKISGPAGGNLTSAASAVTNVTGLIQGVYQFELRVTDNSGAFGRDTVRITVNPAPNVAPTANAGADQTITLPVNTVTLSGFGTDPDGNITGHLWTKIAGPASGTITNATNAVTNVTGLTQGVYQFELRVADNSGAFGRDTMRITVNPALNVAPTANAGANQIITLPINTTTLTGSGNDPDGNIVSYYWIKTAGPAGGFISTPSNATTNVTGLTQGIYQFELTVTDNDGAVGRATVQVAVSASNIPPIANAGPDQNITLPVSTVTLSGSGSDADGTIASYQWVKIAGPNAGVITNANAAITTVTGLIGGIYQYELTVTDNNGAVSKDVMQLIVFVPNVAPTANAGLNQSLSLPTNTATLTGSGNDTDGTIVSYLWTKISGPANGGITNAASAVTGLAGLVAGIYVFELRVTDNSGAFGRATVQVTVNPANIPPVANAGPDQNITLPDNKVTLSGSGNDVDGTIVGYAWRQIAGPADKLTSLYTPVTVVDALVEGSYKFELTVTDNKGATGKDTVAVEVKPLKINTQSNSIKAYPNPVVNTTTLEVNRDNSGQPIQISIVDMQGKIVYQKQVVQSNIVSRYQLDCSKFSKGIYIVNVHFSATEKDTFKMIKL